MSPEKQALKLAFGRLVRAAGGQEAAVGFTRFARHQAFSDFASAQPEHDARFAPIDAVADLEAVTCGAAGHPIVTRQLARQAGFALVPLPRARACEADFAVHLARVVTESADVTAALSYHLRAVPDAASARALREETAQAIQALVELDAALAAVIGGEG